MSFIVPQCLFHVDDEIFPVIRAAILFQAGHRCRKRGFIASLGRFYELLEAKNIYERDQLFRELYFRHSHSPFVYLHESTSSCGAAVISQ
jgi:hypothetical protein